MLMMSVTDNLVVLKMVTVLMLILIMVLVVMIMKSQNNILVKEFPVQSISKYTETIKHKIYMGSCVLS